MRGVKHSLSFERTQGRRILVVDDDESILDALVITLEDEGYIVETTPKGEETFQEVSRFKPDLILLDVLMSGLDGREICRQLKAQQETKRIPVIMISAHPTAKSASLEYGAEAFLPKPFETSELLTYIRRLLRRPD